MKIKLAAKEFKEVIKTLMQVSNTYNRDPILTFTDKPKPRFITSFDNTLIDYSPAYKSVDGSISTPVSFAVGPLNQLSLPNAEMTIHFNEGSLGISCGTFKADLRIIVTNPTMHQLPDSLTSVGAYSDDLTNLIANALALPPSYYKTTRSDLSINMFAVSASKLMTVGSSDGYAAGMIKMPNENQNLNMAIPQSAFQVLSGKGKGQLDIAASGYQIFMRRGHLSLFTTGLETQAIDFDAVCGQQDWLFEAKIHTKHAIEQMSSLGLFFTKDKSAAYIQGTCLQDRLLLDCKHPEMGQANSEIVLFDTKIYKEQAVYFHPKALSDYLDLCKEAKSVSMRCSSNVAHLTYQIGSNLQVEYLFPMVQI